MFYDELKYMKNVEKRTLLSKTGSLATLYGWVGKFRTISKPCRFKFGWQVAECVGLSLVRCYCLSYQLTGATSGVWWLLYGSRRLSILVGSVCVLLGVVNVMWHPTIGVNVKCMEWFVIGLRPVNYPCFIWSKLSHCLDAGNLNGLKSKAEKPFEPTVTIMSNHVFPF